MPTTGRQGADSRPSRAAPTPPGERRGGRGPIAVLRPLAIGAIGGLLLIIPRPAAAYPTAIVFSPSGEALTFGNFGFGTIGAINMSPLPPAFGSGWLGFTAGVVPSIDIHKTPVGMLGLGGAEVGFDLVVDATGTPIFNFNAKIQILQEAKYWPATSIGIFELSPDSQRNLALGYIVASKALKLGDTYIGQFTLGLMRSFGDPPLVTPGCLKSGAPRCLFRGSSPFEDENGALLAGYFSPWFGPFGFGIDYVGGTSDVSSANFSLNLRLWNDDHGGFAVLGAGGYLGNDRRPSPPGPGAFDGLFLNFTFAASLTKILGSDPTKEWLRPPLQKGRGVRPEDPFDAPPLETPQPTRD